MDPTRPTPVKCTAWTLAVAALVSTPGFAADDLKDEEATETIIVTADRVPKFNDTRVDEREGAQLISREYVRAQLATTLADALRKTTSVQVDEEAGNQGSIISIRGMQGDGVSVRIDGAPQNFNQVRHGGANTVWAEPDLYKTITVIPGAASNIYGNGSLGGVVKLETIDPDDLLGEEAAAVTVRAGHETNGNAFVRSLEGAYQLTDSLSGLAYVLMRNNGTYEDGSGTETLGGATGSEDTNSLVKISFTHEAHTLESARRSLAKEYTARGTQSRGRVVSATDQFTQVDDATTTLQYGFAPPENDWVNANVRYSILDVERDRRTADTQWSTWASKTDYLELENTSVLNRDGWAHRLRYGADFTNDDLVTAYFDADGDQIERTRDIAGIYLSDTFDIGERLSVVASLRRDDYRTQDSSSADETRNTALSNKLQVSYRPFASGTMEGLSLFALVGTGFRAPSVHETFGRGETGVICSQGRRGFACSERIPNADLAAETNNSWEAGIRFAGEGVRRWRPDPIVGGLYRQRRRGLHCNAAVAAGGDGHQRQDLQRASQHIRQHQRGERRRLGVLVELQRETLVRLACRADHGWPRHHDRTQPSGCQPAQPERFGGCLPFRRAGSRGVGCDFPRRQGDRRGPVVQSSGVHGVRFFCIVPSG